MSPIHRHLFRIAAAGLMAAGLAGPARAGIVISDLYNTGVNSDGTLATNGSTDLHYTVVNDGPTAPAAGAPFVYQAGTIGPWVTSPVAQWLSPYPSSQYTQANEGFTYTTMFTIGNDADLLTAVITGQLSVDDKLLDVRLNGNSLGITTGDEVYGSWKAFSITSFFQKGANTLEFVTLNTHNGPTGLIVDMEGQYNAVPEPASLSLMGAGLVGLMGLRQWRKRNA
jgi:hypothetical protein